MLFVCAKRCFWRGRLWEPGDTVEISADEAGLTANCMVSGVCWRKLDAPGSVAKAPNAGDAPAPVGDLDPEVEGPLGPAEGEGTNLRAVMLDLCLKHGIKVAKNAGLEVLRSRLADNGIQVN
jgi:hypothetical protein